MGCGEHCCAICVEYKEIVANIMTDGVSCYALGNKTMRGLCFLAKHYGQLCLKEDIEIYVWGCAKPSENNLSVLIFELRRFLKSHDYQIISVRQKGYLLVKKSEVFC